MAFGIGDVVQLKGGGPTMTIVGLGRDGDSGVHALCAWFDSEDHHHSATYPTEALRVHEEAKPAEDE